MQIKFCKISKKNDDLILSLPMMLKEQVASFPAASLNTYVTCVFPTGKLLPGWCDLITVGCIPLSSVAVGSVHVTTLDGVPMDTV